MQRDDDSHLPSLEDGETRSSSKIDVWVSSPDSDKGTGSSWYALHSILTSDAQEICPIW